MKDCPQLIGKIKRKLVFVFMKHCAPTILLVDKGGALFLTRVILSLKLLAILLSILYQLTKFEAPSHNNIFEISGLQVIKSKIWKE